MLKMNITYTTQEELDEILTLLSQQYEEVALAKKTKKQKENEVTVVAKGIRQDKPPFRAPFLPKQKRMYVADMTHPIHQKNKEMIESLNKRS